MQHAIVVYGREDAMADLERLETDENLDDVAKAHNRLLGYITDLESALAALQAKHERLVEAAKNWTHDCCRGYTRPADGVVDCPEGAGRCEMYAALAEERDAG